MNLSEHLSVVKAEVDQESQKLRDSHELRRSIHDEVSYLDSKSAALSKEIESKEAQIKSINTREILVRKEEEKISLALQQLEDNKKQWVYDADMRLDALEAEIRKYNQTISELDKRLVDMLGNYSSVEEKILSNIKSLEERRDQESARVKELKIESDTAYHQVLEARRELYDIYSVIKGDRSDFMNESDRVRPMFDNLDERKKTIETKERDIKIITARLKKIYKEERGRELTI